MQKDIDLAAIRPTIVTMLRVNMGLRPGERVLVITDAATPEQWASLPPGRLVDMARRTLLARHVAEIATEAFPSNSVRFYVYPATGRSGSEPPESAAREMKAAQVVVAITSFSVTHTEARAEACLAGARVASMPGFHPEMLYPGGPIAVDYQKVADDSRRLASLLTAARLARVRCPAGTDITFSLDGRTGRADHGLYTEPGTWGNLPAGEAYIAPVEGTAHGVVVVQAGWHPGLDEPMQLVFEAGEVVDIRGGGSVGSHLRNLLAIGTTSPRPEERARRQLAELGIGTNPHARRTDVTLEAEKIVGTVHLAIGDSSHMGGQTVADFHQDFVLPEATLELDGQVVIEHGAWRFL